MPDSLTVNDMVKAFRELGLKPGDSFIVHSSYKSLGPVDGGPDAVIDALIEAVAPNGNVVFPTFNYTQNVAVPYFDVAVVPCRTGIIPELSRKRPNAVRSLHPTHSVTVIGPDADEITKDHMSFRTVGFGSPIDRLMKMGGKVLLLGVGHTSNTTIHLGEEYAEVPKVGWSEEERCAMVLMPDGSIYPHPLDTSTSCSHHFGPVGDVLRKYGETNEGMVGGAQVQLMQAADVVKRVQEIIAAQPDALLCDSPTCRPCSGARRNLGRC